MLDENAAAILKNCGPDDKGFQNNTRWQRQRCRSESYCNGIMCVRITDAVHAVCTSARVMSVCEYRVPPNVFR